MSCLNSPLRVILSNGLMLAALTRTRTSRRPTMGSGTSAARGPAWPYFSTTKAFMIAVLWDGAVRFEEVQGFRDEFCVVLEDASVAGVALSEEDICKNGSTYSGRS